LHRKVVDADSIEIHWLIQGHIQIRRSVHVRRVHMHFMTAAHECDSEPVYGANRATVSNCGIVRRNNMQDAKAA
jgi:hypothetical protein